MVDISGICTFYFSKTGWFLKFSWEWSIVLFFYIIIIILHQASWHAAFPTSQDGFQPMDAYHARQTKRDETTWTTPQDGQ